MIHHYSLGVQIKFCKPDSLVFRHKLERPRYIPHHPLLHHISSNYQSPNSLFRPCIMCAFKTTKLTNRKNTFCMPPLNLSHFLGKLLLFYFLGSRTPDLKFMVGMWLKNLQFESYLRIQKSSESRLNLLKQLGQTEWLTLKQRSVFAAHWMLSGHLSLSSPQSQDRQKSGFSSDPFLQVLNPSHMELGGKHPLSAPDPGQGIFASDFSFTNHICQTEAHTNLIRAGKYFWKPSVNEGEKDNQKNVI